VGRERRLLLAGTLAHVTVRGNDKGLIVLDVADNLRLVRRIGEAEDTFDWVIHSYCLMTTHYHMLVETPKPNLDKGMHWLNHVYAKGFNLRHGRRDHVFGSRYGSKIQTSDEQLIGTVAYIARNPVKAGLCKHPAEWPWSNFGELRELAYGNTTALPSAFGELVARGARLADERPKP
jgi:REP element-mobilizing transposase RayT